MEGLMIMPKTSLIQVRVDDRLKHDAETLFSSMGIDMPSAIRMFLKQSLIQNSIPFAIKGTGTVRKIYTIEEIKDIVAPIAKFYGIKEVYLFGSYARGEATTDSDIDLCIEKGDLKSLLKLGAFESKLKDALGIPVDVITMGGLKPDLRNIIEKEWVKIYGD